MAEQPLETDEVAEELPPDMAEMFEPADAPIDNSPTQHSGAGGPVVLKDRYMLDTATPLPGFDSPSAKAYLAEDRRDLGLKLFALICSPEISTRIAAIRLQKDSDSAGRLDLIDWDVIYWPPLGQRTMVIIFVQPRGGRVLHRLARKEIRITEYDVPRKLAEPLANILQKIAVQEGPHRAIRPENIFFRDEDMTEIIIGENVSSPPGFDQPTIFEPVERAMADPAGRGIGSTRDDIFALGVTIGILVLGHNPVAKTKDEDLIKARLEQGSYAVIFGNSRVPLPLLEPLRGMLNDDPVARWDFNEISNWLTGQRTAPAKKRPIRKAENPYPFRGKEYLNARSLAQQFSQKIQDAAKTAGEETFETWLKRSLGDAGMAESVKGLIQAAKFHKDGYQGSDEYVTCQLCMLLDPMGPIRYKSVSFMPDGFGPMAASQMLHNDNGQLIGEILSYDMISAWLNNQSPPYPGTSELRANFISLKGFISIKEIGYGLERVLYEINPSLPCHSPLIAQDYVMQIEHMLPALNKAASNADTNQRPIDRHIAAFIATRFDQDIHPHLKALASDARDTSIVGLLSLYAFLQWKLREQQLLGLSSWVGGLLGPVINSYHNRITRGDIEKEIPRLVRKGSLPELFDLVDNAERRKDDRDGYTEARAEWLAAEEEVNDIEGAGDERITRAERAGQQAAAVISIVITLTMVPVLLILQTW
ncbi:MAG: hypothetical protein HQ483_06180 [Rhodospirillales bacterium]|nr:hypothetical protein [Rhodospirillales bacterium]